jgi:hypothetical protein
VPKNVRDFRGFLVLASFYRRLEKDFASIAKPLRNLTKKTQPFICGQGHEETFEGLKHKLFSTPVLLYPKFEKPF